MFYQLNNHHPNTYQKMVLSLCGTISKGINMYYLGSKMCTLGNKMYLSGTNMQHLGVNEVQRCTFWKVPSQWQFLDHLFLRINVHTTVQTNNRTVCLSFTSLHQMKYVVHPNQVLLTIWSLWWDQYEFWYQWTTVIGHTLRFTTVP